MSQTSTIRRLSTAITAGVFTVLALSAPANAEPDWGHPTTAEGSTTVVREVDTPVDDDALEFAQIGLAALAGMTLAGAGMAAVNVRRQHRQPRPA